jgi:MYXO-CTERM domain-containing protein
VCDLQFCLDPNNCRAYYSANGREFSCASCQDVSACVSAVASYCSADQQARGGSDSSSADDDLGCAASAGQAPGGFVFAAWLAALLGWRRRASVRPPHG